MASYRSYIWHFGGRDERCGSGGRLDRRRGPEARAPRWKITGSACHVLRPLARCNVPHLID